MKEMDVGKDKVKKICDILRRETLEPAQAEADFMREEAGREKEKMLQEARLEIEAMQRKAAEQLEQQKKVFHSSLVQASKQVIEALKQSIEEKLFNQELEALVQTATNTPQIAATLISAIVDALAKEGIDANLSAYISKALPAHEVNALLAQEIVSKLKEKSVLISPIGGGVEVKIEQNKITLDLSDKALRELIAGYTRKDFRAMIFQA